MTERPETLRYGVVSAEDQRALSGLDFVQAIVDGRLPHNAMAETLGYWIASAADGRVTIRARPSAAHFNPAGTVHGGFSATLLDSCMGLAVHSTLPRGWGQTTLEFKVSFVRPITVDTGLITAEGQVLSRGRRAGTAEGRLTDAQGRLLVHGTTTCLILENQP
ncbi:PaaI family thioesterase [Reyranella sp. CPCC 100927]|uniref:PaaI family thioesterase n=1 Tax=Reyranella sp. CPCC 100927 TaxID=2599616 RepID=UPI0011B712E7|nr:PaaI family thioesterase [Reyranella sp. CPCC 100927]TWT15599.1 PaaI family thioesterase [Reyranella sp. CPCC 100927]